MAKMAASITEQGQDAFKSLFKYYKRRSPPPDYSNVIDFRHAAKSDKVLRTSLDTGAVDRSQVQKVGLRPVHEWKAFGVDGFPGFVFISDPFLPGAQHPWLMRCVRECPRKPNLCNLDMHMPPALTRNIWESSADLMRRKSGEKSEPKTLLEKLRWVTLGYHYNWDTKTYSAERHTPFPADLERLAQQVATACGFPGFSAQAGILNYYRCDSSLGIHVDESELDHSWPLLSFSFGQSAIFLLGGAKREDPPTAMFVHSGDIMVMSGASRLLYHAVPRILAPPSGVAMPFSSSNVPQGSTVEDWEVCARYIQTSRVNMTVRQVLAAGQSFPPVEEIETCPSLPEESYHQEVTIEEDHTSKRKRSNLCDSKELPL